MSNVFISYSNKDRDFVERLAQDLDGHAIEVFYDQRIPPGESWAGSLTRAIEAAQFLLVVLSTNSVGSPWVAQEVSIGLAREVEGRARVIPLLIEPCEIPLALENKTYASFDSNYDAGFNRVLAVLKGNSTETFVSTEPSAQQAEQIRSDVAQFKSFPRAITPAGEYQKKPGQLRCFVVMPFGNEDLQIVYEDFVKPVLMQDCNLDVERGDDVFGSNVIMDDIRASISAADLIIADLTGKNANVFYEVGICHALEKPVLLLAQSMEDVPFDLRHRRVLLYTYTPRGCKRLEGTLREQVHSVTTNVSTGGA